MVVKEKKPSKKEVDALEAEEQKFKKYSEEEIKKFFENATSTEESQICCAIYGDEETGKSGAAMDCRSPAEVKAGMKVIIIDMDGGNAPIKKMYHNGDKNIIILDPTEMNEDNEFDYISTYHKTQAIIAYIRKLTDAGGIKAVIFDGVDSLLKTCEYVMKQEFLEIDIEDRVENRFMWQIRNQKFYGIIQSIKNMQNVDRYFITHNKYVKNYVTDPDDPERKNLEIVDSHPDWQEKTGEKMFQILRMEKNTEGNKTKLIAHVEKCKTDLGLIGSSHEIARVSSKGGKWNGLRTLFASMGAEEVSEKSSKEEETEAEPEESPKKKPTKKTSKPKPKKEEPPEEEDEEDEEIEEEEPEEEVPKTKPKSKKNSKSNAKPKKKPEPEPEEEEDDDDEVSDEDAEDMLSDDEEAEEEAESEEEEETEDEDSSESEDEDDIFDDDDIEW